MKFLKNIYDLLSDNFFSGFIEGSLSAWGINFTSNQILSCIIAIGIIAFILKNL